jgi:hypothetical protein
MNVERCECNEDWSHQDREGPVTAEERAAARAMIDELRKAGELPLTIGGKPKLTLVTAAS